MKENSRKDFLKAGLLVGGAVYGTPAAALALRGGRPFNSDFEHEVEYQHNPKTTTLGDLVPGSYLPGNTGSLTLDDLGAISETNLTDAKKLYKEFQGLTFGDLAAVSTYLADHYGPSTTIFRETTGIHVHVTITCCCCTCCC